MLASTVSFDDQTVTAEALAMLGVSSIRDACATTLPKTNREMASPRRVSQSLATATASVGPYHPENAAPQEIAKRQREMIYKGYEDKKAIVLLENVLVNTASSIEDRAREMSPAQTGSLDLRAVLELARTVKNAHKEYSQARQAWYQRVESVALSPQQEIQEAVGKWVAFWSACDKLSLYTEPDQEAQSSLESPLQEFAVACHDLLETAGNKTITSLDHFRECLSERAALPMDDPPHQDHWTWTVRPGTPLSDSDASLSESTHAIED